MASINLLSNTSRVETPFIKVTIGEYTFGVFDRKVSKGTDSYGNYTINNIKYPNYIQSLQIEKINGAVNKYTLVMSYPVTDADDPNFFYKVFSSVSQTRKIVFSYGDLSAPTYCYRDEEAIILKVRQTMNASSAVIQYTVSAVSSGKLLTSGARDFPGGKYQPSNLIKDILYNPQYGLQDVFYGMTNKELVEQEGLILSDDIEVTLEAKNNISVLDYLYYLVASMTDSPNNNLKKDSFYSLVVVDDVSGKFKGPYFKIIKTNVVKEMPAAFDLDIGYPSQNIILNFDVEDDEGYTIFYNFNEELNTDEYVQRINDRGELEEVYAPILSSGNLVKKTTEAEKTWWTKITQFPIKARLTIKGLLRPAILMTHVRLNVYFYGRKHVSSGLYIVTKQVDNVSAQGFRTTLSLLRIGKSTDLDIV